MRVGLMVPCYIDVFYPQVGVATLELLEKVKGVSVVDFDRPDECCGFGGTFAVCCRGRRGQPTSAA